MTNSASLPDYGGDRNAVLNGIAYDKQRDTFVITGKMWDLAFELKLDYAKYIK